MFSFLKAAVSGRSGTIAQKYKFEIIGLQMSFNTAPLGDLSASFIRGMCRSRAEPCAVRSAYALLFSFVVHMHSHPRTGPRTAESKFTSPDAGSFGCKYTFAEPLALLCTLYRDEKTGVCQAKEGKITVTLRIAKGVLRAYAGVNGAGVTCFLAHAWRSLRHAHVRICYFELVLVFVALTFVLPSVEKSFAKLDFDLAPYAQNMNGSSQISCSFSKCSDKNARITFTIRATWMKELDGQECVNITPFLCFICQHVSSFSLRALGSFIVIASVFTCYSLRTLACQLLYVLLRRPRAATMPCQAFPT